MDKIAPGVYHWRDGWHFGRDHDGSVRIFQFQLDGSTVSVGPIPPNEWASIVAAVSRSGETALTYVIADALHSTPQTPRDVD